MITLLGFAPKTYVWAPKITVHLQKKVNMVPFHKKKCRKTYNWQYYRINGIIGASNGLNDTSVCYKLLAIFGHRNVCKQTFWACVGVGSASELGELTDTVAIRVGQLEWISTIQPEITNYLCQLEWFTNLVLRVIFVAFVSKNIFHISVSQQVRSAENSGK